MTESVNVFLTALLEELVRSGSFSLMLIGLLVGVVLGSGLGIALTVFIVKLVK